MIVEVTFDHDPDWTNLTPESVNFILTPGEVKTVAAKMNKTSCPE